MRSALFGSFGAGITRLRHAPLVRATVGAVGDLFLPRVCVACDRGLARGESDVVCGRCWARIATLPLPQCPRCGHPHLRHSCRWCTLLPPYVRAVRSVCWVPGGSAGEIVHALKYDGWSAVAEGMAARMARLAWPRDVVDERAALVPVPLAAERLRERGYNQSALLARALGHRWCVPVWDDVLTRGRATESQTRLTADDRLRNVAGAFHASPSAAPRLAGAHILLVDDVVTTGATLNECAEALIEAGARIISYVTFGRARTASDRPLS